MSDSEEDNIFKKKKQKQSQKQQQVNIKAKRVLYCPICTLPVEYCEFNLNPIPCVNWLQQTHPNIYSKLYQKHQQEIQQLQQIQSKRNTKIKQSEKVYLKVKTIQNKKQITIIDGLEKHDIDLKEAQQRLSKKFGCGSTIKDDTLQLQGDLKKELLEMLGQEYPQIKPEMVLQKD